MGRPPAYIFVVRHGNRLDTADKQWHLSSPAPYDPPLTYGGWLQSKALGARIASILQDDGTHTELGEDVSKKNGHKKRRRYRIIIHSSPFLRCIQTSVAVSAGLASGHSKGLPNGSRSPLPTNHDRVTLEKAVLRLDSFLGEWLSPGYFEQITPPPRSSLMLINAKTDLLRNENYHSYPNFRTRPAPKPTLPSQLWNSPSRDRNSHLSSTAEAPESDEDLSAEQLPPTRNEGRNQRVALVTRQRAGTIAGGMAARGYASPVPAYPVSTNEPIPSGYVSHARDACLKFDQQWDSSREPLGWGDGGSLPEEWPGMHQRFRKGLKRLVEWYAKADHPADMVTKLPKKVGPNGVATNGEEQLISAQEEEEGSDTENIVILVSHGAGCNALAGGISNAPVLVDVPTSSLTISKRKSEFDDICDATNEKLKVSLEDALLHRLHTIAELYDLTLLADTSHLQPAGQASYPGRSVSSSGFGGLPQGHPHATSASTLNTAEPMRSKSPNASLGSMRRGPHATLTIRGPFSDTVGSNGISADAGSAGLKPPSRDNSWGMWSPQIVDETPEKSPSLGLSQDNKFESKTMLGSLQTTPTIPPSPPADADDRRFSIMAGDRVDTELESVEYQEALLSTSSWAGSGNGGLWGASPRPPGEAERKRDLCTSKRRWTVTERPQL